jgi:2-dehydropantoate 2-reductase
MMRMLVVGAGATGGYFGGRLAEAGRDVTFLVRPRRAEQLRAHGLRIVSPCGNLTLQPALASADTIDGSFDIVLVTVKAFALEAAMADFAPAVGPATTIVPVLNGMKHIDLLRGRFGQERVAGGVCKIGATVDEDARIIHFNEMHTLIFGELNGATGDRIRQVDGFMREAGFDARLSEEIQGELWRKWIMLAGLGAVTGLMRGNIGEVAAAPGGKAVALQILSEVVAVARGEGASPSDDFVKDVAAMLTADGSSGASSMYRDLRKGNPIEVEQIIGDLVARARSHALATPFLDVAYASLSIYQKRLAQAQQP